MREDHACVGCDLDWNGPIRYRSSASWPSGNWSAVNSGPRSQRVFQRLASEPNRAMDASLSAVIVVSR